MTSSTTPSHGTDTAQSPGARFLKATEIDTRMLGMVGAGQDETTDTPRHDSVRMRLPWLLVNMFNSALSACVVYLFDGSIAQMAILAVFMPMVANQAGNTGQQALAVMIRQLAMERFARRKAWWAVLREGKNILATTRSR